MTQDAATNAAPLPGSPEYDVAMAAKWRASKGDEGTGEKPTESAPSERPEHIPEKFWRDGKLDTDALLKSYTELEKTRGAGKAPDPLKIEGEQPGQTTTTDAAKDATNAAGLDWNVLQQKIATQGALDDSDYSALAKAGIPKDVIDGHVKLVQDRLAAEKREAIQYLGGEKAANAALSWAAQNLSEQDKAQINALLASPNWRIGLDAIKARMGAASRTAGEPEAGAYGNQPSAPPGYRSRAQMKADMASPQYRNDPAFREQVAQKMRNATWDLDR